jgi:hypothetical protein
MNNQDSMRPWNGEMHRKELRRLLLRPSIFCCGAPIAQQAKVVLVHRHHLYDRPQPFCRMQ